MTAAIGAQGSCFYWKGLDGHGSHFSILLRLLGHSFPLLGCVPFSFFGQFFPMFGFRPVFHSIPGSLTRSSCCRTRSACKNQPAVPGVSLSVIGKSREKHKRYVRGTWHWIAHNLRQFSLLCNDLLDAFSNLFWILRPVCEPFITSSFDPCNFRLEVWRLAFLAGCNKDFCPVLGKIWRPCYGRQMQTCFASK